MPAEEARAGEILLEIRDLRAGTEEREILTGVTLTIRRGEIHAIMGPNGSGKSTLSYVLAGRPGYRVSGGEVLYKGEDLLALPADERARRGVFLAFQYPVEIPGLSVVNFLRAARNAVHRPEMPPLEFHRFLRSKLSLLDMDEGLVRRYLNEGFSGGEKKRNEILQMAVLEPEMAILDETDSGLDIDALKDVSRGINAVAGERVGVLLITHYQRILNYVTPHVIHVLVAGRIARSGGPELATELERTGYDSLREEEAAAAGPLA
ncbi:MAG: Fe-S cluster assembly ATPase SufC [Acidobacteria bacterium]|nr:Fe-S cluster assembly ATPase SufC [Acidobacteriota bacterium]